MASSFLTHSVVCADLGSGTQVLLHLKFLPLWFPMLGVAPSHQEQFCIFGSTLSHSSSASFHLRHSRSHDLDIFSDPKAPRMGQVSGLAWVRSHSCSIQLILRVRQGNNVGLLVELHRCATGKSSRREQGWTEQKSNIPTLKLLLAHN